MEDKLIIDYEDPDQSLDDTLEWVRLYGSEPKTIPFVCSCLETPKKHAKWVARVLADRYFTFFGFQDHVRDCSDDELTNIMCALACLRETSGKPLPINLPVQFINASEGLFNSDLEKIVEARDPVVQKQLRRMGDDNSYWYPFSHYAEEVVEMWDERNRDVVERMVESIRAIGDRPASYYARSVSFANEFVNRIRPIECWFRDSECADEMKAIIRQMTHDQVRRLMINMTGHPYIVGGVYQFAREDSDVVEYQIRFSTCYGECTISNPFLEAEADTLISALTDDLEENEP